MGVDVSVVIVSYNAMAYLEQCLLSVRNYAGTSSTEIFVVDNASSDGSPDMVAEQFPEVTLIRSEVNAGFGAANNQAIPLCQGEFVLLLNNDAELTEGCLDEVLRFMRDNPKCGAAGCSLVGSDGRQQASIKRFKSLLNMVWPQIPLLYRWRTSWGWSDYDLGKISSTEPTSVDYICGAFMMVRRTALDQIGLFDERFFMYSEEEDLCKRLKATGWEVCYVPTATAIHRGGMSAKVSPGRMNCEFHRSRVLYMRKHHGIIGELSYRILYGGVTILGMITKVCSFVVSPRRRKSAANELRAMKQAVAVCFSRQRRCAGDGS